MIKFDIKSMNYANITKSFVNLHNNKINYVNYFIMIILLYNCSIQSAISKKQVYPQEDGQSWLSVQFKNNIYEKIDFEISEELRYNKYSTILNQSLSDLGVSYKFSDIYKVGVFYRYRYDDESKESRPELYANFTFKPYSKDFFISTRTRLHIKFRDDDETINNFREQVTIGYKISDFCKLYSATEVYYRFLYDEGDRFTQARYTIGLSFELTNFLEMDTYFMREQEYNNDKAINSNIAGLSLTFNFN